MYGMDGRSKEMAIRTLSVVEIRNNLADVMAQVAYSDLRFVVERKGRPMVALVSIEDLRRLEALEDARDSELLRHAKAASRGTVPLDQMIAEYEREQGLAVTEVA
jgi:prevent-host-death family protein